MNLKKLILEEIEAFDGKPDFEELYKKIQSIKNINQYYKFLEKKLPEYYNGDEDYPEWFYEDFQKYVRERKKEEVLDFIKKSHLLIKLYGYEYNYEEKFGEYYDDFLETYGMEFFLGNYDYKDEGRIERKIKKKRGLSTDDGYSLLKADKSGVDYDLLNKLHDYNYKNHERYDSTDYFSFIHLSKQKILGAVEDQIAEQEEGFQGVYRDPEKNIITLPAPDSKKKEITNIRQGEHQIDVLKAKYDSVVNPLKQKYPNMKVLDFAEFTSQQSIPSIIEIPQWYYNAHSIPEWFKTYIEHIKDTNPDGTFERFLLDNENNFGKLIGNYQLFANKIKREYWRIKGRIEQGVDVLTRTIKDEMRLGSFDPKTYTSILALKDKGENQGSDIVTDLIKSASNYISHKHQLAASNEEEPEDEDEGEPEYDDTKQDYYATMQYHGIQDTEENWEDYLDWRSDGYSNKGKNTASFNPYEKWWFKKYGPSKGRYYNPNRGAASANKRVNDTLFKHMNNPDFWDAMDQAERNDEDFDWNYWEEQEPKDNFTGTDDDARQRVEQDKVRNSISTIDKFLQAARVSKVDPEAIRNLEKLLSNSDIQKPTPELKKAFKKVYRLIVNQLHPDKQLTPEQKKKSEEAFKSFTNDIYDKLPSVLKESLSFKDYFKLIL
jgi:hypothetical protein